MKPDEKQRARVLYVDDEQHNLDLFRRSFSGTMEVHTARSGPAALELMKEIEFSVVICDQRMPEMTGTELLAEVCNTYPDTVRMLATGFADFDAVVSAINEGRVARYIRKPWDVHDVRATILNAHQLYEKVRENRRLLRELSEANATIEAANRELEAKVAERTEQLERLTITDDVTGLYNQRFLHNRLEAEYSRAVRYKHALAVLMLDLDFFKNVNDSHDHLFGSKVLKRAGDVILDTVREFDLVIRYGGDEFVVIMPETDGKGGALAGERVRAALEGAEVGEPGVPYQVTVSVGVAALDVSGAQKAQDLLKAADDALYESKRRNRNCVFVAVEGKMVPGVELAPVLATATARAAESSQT